MNRRRFLELLGLAALGSGIVYSFPSVIVPKNIAFENIEEFAFSGYKMSDVDFKIRAEIYPRIINDMFFTDSPDLAYWRKRLAIPLSSACYV